MQIYAINGSPRKKWNTATLLEKALIGAKSVDANCQTEMVHLYDLKYTGCKSCFACKLLGGPSYGKCAIKDDLAPLLENIAKADALILGTPIYFGNYTAMMLAFLERLLFQYLVYDKNFSSLAPKKLKTAFIYTMNVAEKDLDTYHYRERFGAMEGYVANMLTKPTVLYACDTFQYDDYSKYKVEYFSPEAKAKHREVQFPIDCENAFKLGQNLVQN